MRRSACTRVALLVTPSARRYRCEESKASSPRPSRGELVPARGARVHARAHARLQAASAHPCSSEGPQVVARVRQAAPSARLRLRESEVGARVLKLLAHRRDGHRRLVAQQRRKLHVAVALQGDVDVRVDEELARAVLVPRLQDGLEVRKRVLRASEGVGEVAFDKHLAHGRAAAEGFTASRGGDESAHVGDDAPVAREDCGDGLHANAVSRRVRARNRHRLQRQAHRAHVLLIRRRERVEHVREEHAVAAQARLIGATHAANYAAPHAATVASSHTSSSISAFGIDARSLLLARRPCVRLQRAEAHAAKQAYLLGHLRRPPFAALPRLDPPSVRTRRLALGLRAHS
eukprot:3190732-Pleurochrysis_carterae.AAC.1